MRRNGKPRRKRVVSDNLVLRPFREADLGAFVEGMQGQGPPVDDFDWFGHMDASIGRSPRMSRRRMFKLFVTSQQDASIFGNPGLRLQIFCRHRRSWFGYMAIYDCRWNVESAAIDYYVLNQHWRRGIASEAVRAALGYCWTELGLHRVEACIDERNVRSIRLAESLGMTFEGVRRHGARINGRWVNLRVYSELASLDT